MSIHGNTDPGANFTKALESRVVRSTDVMEALCEAFESLKRQTLPVSEVGAAVYKALLAVPEFNAEALQPIPVARRHSEKPLDLMCDVCLETFTAEDNVTYCCGSCGRCGFCEECSSPNRHDCEPEI